MKHQPDKFGDAFGRWAGFGPYYAMFPVNFARKVIETMSTAKSCVIDPFCGRGTAPFIAQATGRTSLGIDLNPVAWIFAKAKTEPEENVDLLIDRLNAVQHEISANDRIPENDFQDWAWNSDVLGFLNAARRMLDWRENKTDRTLMGFILAHIHAKRGAGLSNQMQNSRSMGPDYAVRWWQAKGMRPPQIDPAICLSKKIHWRYRHGTVGGKEKTQIKLGNSVEILSRQPDEQFDLLFTSPPYCRITDYRQDSWIRLWALGEGPALPDWKKDAQTSCRSSYKEMICDVLSKASRLLTPRGVIWIRTDAREYTKNVTVDAMRNTWPHRRLYMRKDIPKNGTQTSHFSNFSKSSGEIDLLIPGRKPLPFGCSDWIRL